MSARMVFSRIWDFDGGRVQVPSGSIVHGVKEDNLADFVCTEYARPRYFGRRCVSFVSLARGQLRTDSPIPKTASKTAKDHVLVWTNTVM